jgi:hypothetical protein
MLLHPLSLVLSQICAEKEDRFEDYCHKIVNIFFLFSQAENQVKEAIADRMTLKSKLRSTLSRIYVVVILTILVQRSSERSAASTVFESNHYAEVYQESFCAIYNS